jgi:hypothetical protein
MRRRRQIGLAAFALLAGILAAPCGQAETATHPVALGNQLWTVAIDPASLEVRARPASGLDVRISAAQAGLGQLAHLRQTADQAHWELPDKGVTVSVRLEGDTLQVGFRARAPGEFTWPVIEPQAAVRGYILPTFEGVYAPANDPKWSAFLAEQGEMSTTEALSLPLWGLDCGDRQRTGSQPLAVRQTLTYLLTNPFNNSLVFRDAAGRLAARLTHQFTRNQPVKEYGLRISLGPGSPIEPARRYRRWLVQTGQFVPMTAKIRRTPEAAKLLGAPQVYLRGDGISRQMMETLASNGFDRLLLLSEEWAPLRSSPETVRKAKALGFLLAPYDSYNSIHSPDAGPDDTWETAQFDRKLYETGAIVRWDGKKKAGFLGKGYRLSPLAARPYVEQRVAGLMSEFHCNAWFIDCDAFGELFDDYSPLHSATQREDMEARLSRMAWVRDTYKVVIGSEGGSAYAASTIHFAQGMTTPIVGWGDPDLKDPQSPYFRGRAWPPDHPASVFKQVPLKPKYARFYFDPRFRLPLYQAAFHDSVITTDHPGSPFLKFRDQITPRTLLELLYNVPPLYYLDRKELAGHGPWMKAHYAFFSPLHREAGLLPLTAFDWLTKDRMVQRTVFGGKIELVANFRSMPFAIRGSTLPGKSILAYRRDTHQTQIYTPGDAAEEE